MNVNMISCRAQQAGLDNGLDNDHYNFTNEAVMIDGDK
jgi:hypothetical protein